MDMILSQALTYKTKRFQKDNHGLRSSIPYQQAKQIGILFSNDQPEKSSMAEKLVNHYRNDGKQVKVLAYDKNVQVKHLPFESFSNKDVNFWGSFVNQSINQFSETPYDFLICLDEDPGKIVQNLIAKSRAKCRVGILSSENPIQNLFELIIFSSNDSNLVDSVYSYTKNIR